jgi:hypothetical protein
MRKVTRSLKLFFALSIFLVLAPRTATAQQANDGTTWGYWVVGGSVILGTTSVLLGLNIDCSRSDFDCQRQASVLIWGGIGFASVGTLTGLTIVQWGERQRVTPATPVSQYSLGLEPSLMGLAFERGEHRSILFLTLRAP